MAIANRPFGDRHNGHTMNGTTPASGAAPPQHTKVADPDADLLLSLARGDHPALGELMNRHLGAIKSLAWHMMGDEMIAEDVAQEVFLRAWKQAPNWQKGKAKFSTWLHRVAKNLCYDRLRKKGEIYSDNLPDMPDETSGAAQVLIENETGERQKIRIEAAMDKLPERQRLAITLCHYQELSQIQAAEIMELGVRAYESLLARGRRNLRKHLCAYKTELLGEIGEKS